MSHLLRGRPRGVVLLYHRVAELEHDPWQLAVSPRRFDEHLAAIRDRFLALPLRALVAGRSATRTELRHVAVTFDDGYRDNALVAKPLLERHDIPATVFVVSGLVDSSEPFWWDQLTHVCTAPECLPGRAELAIGGARISFDLSPLSRHEACHVVGRRLRELSDEARRAALRQLADAFGVSSTAPTEAMSSNMVRELDSDLVEVGAHTVSHPLLSRLPRELLPQEIQACKAQLESILGRAVTAFAYPHGDSSRQARAHVRKAGFELACTTVPAAVTSRTRRYAVPRLTVADWPADVLVSRIEALLS